MITSREVHQYMDLVYRLPHMDDDELESLRNYYFSCNLSEAEVTGILEREMARGTSLLDIIICHRKLYYESYENIGVRFKMNRDGDK